MSRPAGIDRRGRCAALLVALAAVAPGLVAGQTPEAEGEPARPTTRIELVVEEARTVDWSPRGDRIAYDRPDSQGFSRLWVAQPDGSNARCLTCDPFDFRKRHAASPVWHPSGDYLVFQLEQPHRYGGAPVPFGAVPGRNREGDLWAIRADGRQFWNLTSRGERGTRVHSPRFSHEGDRLTWVERVASGGGLWGTWSLRVARWSVSRGVPRLKSAKAYKPARGRRFYESYGFTPDDRGLLFGSNLIDGQSEDGLDLYLLDLESGEVERLTDSIEDLDRFGRFSPDGGRIVWSSNRGLRASRASFGRRDVSAQVALDLWVMDGEGRGAKRLTHFNDIFADEYLGGQMMAGAAAWSREGDRLLVPAVPVGRTRTGGGLYLVRLDDPGR